MTETSATGKARYGLDAPGVIRNLGVPGLLICAIVIFFPIVKIGSATIDTTGLIWSGVGLCIGAGLMLLYSLYGKFKHRDKMLNMIS